MHLFSEEFLSALGGWQRGWREIQSDRLALGLALIKASSNLPAEFRTVEHPCYRKRFIHEGEFVDLFLVDQRDEGIASWTTDLKFAERLKGLTRPDAISGAIFRHTPTPDEVVLNTVALWKSDEFRTRAAQYRKEAGKDAKALWNFRDTQAEIILTSPLKGSEVIALTGTSSPFDQLCDRENIAESQRDGLFKMLVEAGVYVGEPTYVDPGKSQAVIAGMIQKFYEKISKLRGS